MATFTVDSAAMNEKAARLDGHADEYDSICAQLKQAATSMGAAYDSEDNHAFVARIEECCVDLKALADKLRSDAGTLREQATMYSNTEAANTQQANRLP